MQLASRLPSLSSLRVCGCPITVEALEAMMCRHPRIHMCKSTRKSTGVAAAFEH
jgi:hypothetical protein